MTSFGVQALHFFEESDEEFFHITFVIFHLPFLPNVLNEKWKMGNDKWKICALSAGESQLTNNRTSGNINDRNRS